MKKKLWGLFTTLFLCFAFTLGFTVGGCTTPEVPNSSSSGGGSDSTDETYEIDNPDSNGLKYKLLTDDTYEVSGIGSCRDTDIGIPSSYNGKAVTSIGDSAFIMNESITSVTMSEGITTIGNRAFVACKNLTRVKLPESVTTVGDQAFMICDNLTSVTIPESINSIGESAFSDCALLKTKEYGNAKYLASKTNDYFALIGTTNKSFDSYGIHKDTKIIANLAFENCDSMESIVIPDNVPLIGSYAFYSCGRLNSVTIGKGVKSIGDSAFDKCISLKEVHVKDLADWCNISFGANLANPIYRRDTATSFNNNIKLYVNNETLTEITIPDGVTSIGSGLFYNCPDLQSVVIPDSVTSIGREAFYGCNALTSVTIGDGVTTIDKDAFNRCRNLTSIKMGKGVTKIEEKAFYWCWNLKSVEIPDTVTFLGKQAFEGCSLTSVAIGNGITSIGERVFYDCDNLTSVYYGGTADDWADIQIASYNNPFHSATVYYYIEKEENVPTDGGKYWHYGENGEIVVWQKNNES